MDGLNTISVFFVFDLVPRTVLKETFDQKIEQDEQDTTISTDESNEDYDRSTPVDQDFYHESYAHPPITKIEVTKYNHNMSKIAQVTSTGTPSSHRKTKDLEDRKFFNIFFL